MEEDIQNTVDLINIALKEIWYNDLKKEYRINILISSQDKKILSFERNSEGLISVSINIAEDIIRDSYSNELFKFIDGEFVKIGDLV